MSRVRLRPRREAAPGTAPLLEAVPTGGQLQVAGAAWPPGRDRRPRASQQTPSSLRGPEATWLPWPWPVARGPQAQGPSSMCAARQRLHGQRLWAPFHPLSLEAQHMLCGKTRGCCPTDDRQQSTESGDPGVSSKPGAPSLQGSPWPSAQTQLPRGSLGPARSPLGPRNRALPPPPGQARGVWWASPRCRRPGLTGNPRVAPATPAGLEPGQGAGHAPPSEQPWLGVTVTSGQHPVRKGQQIRVDANGIPGKASFLFCSRPVFSKALPTRAVWSYFCK